MKTLIIEKDQLIENIKSIKSFVDSKKTIAVVKCNGYGLGLIEFASVLVQNGIDFLAVSDIDEAVKLRQNGFTQNILLLSATSIEHDLSLIIKHGIIASIGDTIGALLLDKLAAEQRKTVKAHIAVETGFGRFGFGSAVEIIKCVSSLKNVHICGAFSHFSNSFGNEKTCKAQYTHFCAILSKLEENHINVDMKHICNSCATFRFPQYHMDGVRIGSAFLGRLPVQIPIKLHKIAHLQSEVCAIKVLPKGSNIGYANTYKTKRNSRIAVVPIGYSDGYAVIKKSDTFRFWDIIRYVYNDLKLLITNTNTYVKISNKPCKLLGRISMYNSIADITGKEINVGDIVTLDCNPIMIDSAIARVYK